MKMVVKYPSRTGTRPLPSCSSCTRTLCLSATTSAFAASCSAPADVFASYDYLLEQHCQEKKAGVARREMSTAYCKSSDGMVCREARYLVTIRVRIRKHPSRGGDPQHDFVSRGSQLAVLFHELAHLRHMNHGLEFMLLVNDIFEEATRRGLFDAAVMRNEMPSRWPWENEIFRTGGKGDQARLLELFVEAARADSREPGSPSRSPSRGPCGRGGAGCGSPGPAAAARRLRAATPGAAAAATPAAAVADGAEGVAVEGGERGYVDELEAAVPAVVEDKAASEEAAAARLDVCEADAMQDELDAAAVASLPSAADGEQAAWAVAASGAPPRPATALRRGELAEAFRRGCCAGCAEAGGSKVNEHAEA